MDNKNSAVPVLSLFSGIGGLDLGAQMAGFSIRAAVDVDEQALSLFSSALGGITIHGKTEEMDYKKVIRDAGLDKNSDAILIGGPPCTGFSHAGFWIEDKRNGKDYQVNRLEDFLNYINALRPRAFVLENVPGLLFRNYKALLDHFLNISTILGYCVSYKVLNAADYGVPQMRKRVFFVGIRKGDQYKFPESSFNEVCRRTSRWAIGNLSPEKNPPEDDEILRGKYAHLLPLVPPGDNYLYFTAQRDYPNPQFGWRKRYWSFLFKMHPDKPSPTIPAQRISNNGPFHWDNRRLRIREIARLQGFPDNYPIGSLSKARFYLGNAVPSLLAAQVFWVLRVQLGDIDPSDPPEVLKRTLAIDASADEVFGAIGEFVSQAVAKQPYYEAK